MDFTSQNSSCFTCPEDILEKRLVRIVDVGVRV